jgi:hypothetical protein
MKMTFPAVEISNNATFEANYYIDRLKLAKEYYFSEKNYYVLPFLSKNIFHASKTIYLPKHPYIFK